MNWLHLALSTALLCSACSSTESQAKKSQSSEDAVAQVERLSTPPSLSIVPQPIVTRDLDEHDLYGAGCYFLDGPIPDGNGQRLPMLFIASDESGWLKLDGKIIELSADRSSDKQPYMSWSKYVGLAYTVHLTRDTTAEKSFGEETAIAPGQIVVRDSHDRVVFKRIGAIECGA